LPVKTIPLAKEAQSFLDWLQLIEKTLPATRFLSDFVQPAVREFSIISIYLPQS